MIKKFITTNFSILAFFLGLVLVFIISQIFPNLARPGSILQPHITSKVAICIIFFISSLRNSFQNILRSIKNVKIMFFSMFFCFFVYPVIGWFFGTVINIFDISSLYTRGYIIATCMPPPVSAGIVLTGIFKGDEGLAMTISSVGNILSAFISPILINFFAEQRVTFFNPDCMSKFIKLSMLIFFPTLLGQFFRNHLPKNICESNKLNLLSKLSLLFIVFCGFSSVVKNSDSKVDFLTIILLVSAIASINGIMSILILMADSKFHITINDSEMFALMFSVTMKSLGTGVAILMIWAEHDPSFMTAILPLVMFEPIQIILSIIIGMGIRKPTVKISAPI